MHDPLQEVLEEIWILREKGKQDVPSLAEGIAPRVGREALESALRSGERDGILERDGDAIRLTPRGEEAARAILRRHRLAEVLFRHVLEVSEREMEETACELEHHLSPAAADAVCAFLGHPPHCPHGRPIPRGECCRGFSPAVRPLIVPLGAATPGREIVVTYIHLNDPQLLDRLGALGIVPGARCRLRAKKPAAVLEIGETSVAVDASLLDQLFVREGR